MSGGQYSTFQFFADGTYECVREFVGAAEAVKAAAHYTTCVGAQIGTTVRVIITNGGDDCVFEWIRERGVVFPVGTVWPPAGGLPI